MRSLMSWLAAAAVFLAPWGSVGVLVVFTGRSVGTGIQPAYLPLGVLVVLSAGLVLRERRWQPGELWMLVALLWLAAAAALSWTVIDVGLAGDVPWRKSLKQLVQAAFFVAAALAFARTLRGGISPLMERATLMGLGLACVVALVLGFQVAGSAAGWSGFLDTNPSMASGSDELYLGHSFTGIARLRGPMPEPLMFGNYLLAVLPLAVLSAGRSRGWGRFWRLLVVGLAVVCLLGTWSRGAWLGGLVGGGLLLVFWIRGAFGPVSRRRAGFAVGAGVCFALLAFAAVMQVGPWEVPGLLARRIGQSLAGHDMSNLTRVWAWKAAGLMTVDAPLTGQGWGSYGFLFYRYAAGGASGAHFGWPVPNNLALLLLAESGLIGLGLWIRALAPCFRPFRRPGLSGSATAVAIGMAGVLAQYSTFSQWNLPHLWILIGAGLALSASREPDDRTAGVV